VRTSDERELLKRKEDEFAGGGGGQVVDVERGRMGGGSDDYGGVGGACYQQRAGVSRLSRSDSICIMPLDGGDVGRVRFNTMCI